MPGRDHKNSLTLDVDACSYTSVGRSSITSTPVSLASVERTWNFRINYPPEEGGRRKPATIGTVIVLLFLVVMITVAVMVATGGQDKQPPEEGSRRCLCDQGCSLSYVETLPGGVTFRQNSSRLPRTSDSWLEVLRSAQRTLDIVSSSWGLLAGSDPVQNDTDVTQGHRLWQELISAGSTRSVRIRILYDDRVASPSELSTLVRRGVATARGVALDNLLKKQSRVHGNLIVADEKTFYLGSAAFSWRSLSQRKNFGVVVSNCTCLARDVTQVFSNLWELAASGTHVQSVARPMHLCLNQQHNVTASVTVSPTVLDPGNNSSTLGAVLKVINSAREYLDISVRDYLPSSRTDGLSYWPVLQEALSRATLSRAIQVRLLVSAWKNTPPDMFGYLQSLSNLHGLGGGHIHVKLFNITGSDGQTPSGPNNSRYVYSEDSIFIGTSDWTKDDFEDNISFGLLLNHTALGFYGNTKYNNIHQQLKAVFERDWNSDSAYPL
ncbi:PREDICTED: phospholipase D3-like [Branchiostoma belcheri]|uniref:Phospholipase D3-like n=1 Tax=Branchiostoma belcheri TaxID=7741 RepID=A0A6P4ZB35_BRABE|nr:PREDICTED: phospholipase D3-like [Branchiostoma belcheri]